MIPSAVPEGPWKTLGTDLFYLKGRTYLLVVDYFSRNVEVSPLLTSQKSSEAIRALKSIFARHGIPEILRSDNGPQFACTEFDQFSKEFAFTHITSSPKLPQANGEAERAVQTVNNALMSYRATPLENGYSPAEMLFGRKIRTTVPVSSDQLKPRSWPDVEKMREHEQKSKLSQMHRYNARYRCTDLPERKVGESAWVVNQKTPAVVTKKDTTPRSYTVNTEAGTTIRRNRRHLVSMPSDNTITGEPMKELESPAKTPQVTPEREIVTSRFGRTIKPPVRLGFT